MTFRDKMKNVWIHVIPTIIIHKVNSSGNFMINEDQGCIF